MPTAFRRARRRRSQHFTGLLIGNDGKVVRILHAGDARPKAATVIDAHGRTLLPGLIDAHGHVTDLGFSALHLNLVGTSSLDDLKQRLRIYAAAHPDAPWIIGFGWNQELWPEKRFPTAADLDAAVPDRPVVLERVDGHAVSRTVRRSKRPASPLRRPRRPAGASRTACSSMPLADLIDKAIPAPTPADLDQALAKAQEILLGFGVTGVGSMSTSVADWEAFRRAGEARAPERAADGLSARHRADAAPCRIRPTGCTATGCARSAIKFFADGALGSRGAWLKQPYADKPDTRGLQFHSDAEILTLADRAAAAGFQIATHAIGDAANAQIIRLYEQLHRKYRGDRRWRIEHFQIVDPADIPRLAPAGIIASMQPTHQTSDRLMAEKRPRPEPACRRLCLADGAQERCEARLRHRLSGGIAEPVSRPVCGDQPAGHQRPAAGRMDPVGAADAWPGAPRLHARRGLCRVRRAEDRRA